MMYWTAIVGTGPGDGAPVHATTSIPFQHCFFSGSSAQNNPTNQVSVFKTVSAFLKVGKTTLNLKEHYLSRPNIKPSPFVFYPNLSTNIKLWQTENVPFSFEENEYLIL